MLVETNLLLRHFEKKKKSSREKPLTAHMTMGSLANTEYAYFCWLLMFYILIVVSAHFIQSNHTFPTF